MRRKVLCCLLIALFSLSLFSVPLKASGYPDKKLVLGVGESYEIAGKPKITVASGSIASVKDGVITGIAPGKTTGTYTENDGVSHKFSIKVKKTGIKVTMLDIGQGDAFLIRVNGKNIVLDTGEKKYYEYLKKQLDYFGVTSVDTLIVSHMDTDHMGAAQLLVQDYGVKTVLMPVTPGNSTEYNKLMNAIDREHVNTVYVHTGDTYSLGTGCNIDILGADLGEGTNDSSIIMKLKYYKNTFLFTGDASAPVLNKLMESGADIKANVLKVAHHGSDYTNPLLFLKNVGAKYALISAGRNNAYGHPNDNVIRRLNTLSIRF
ncbi:MAG: MBL fold metallo-hydrolase [Lachnospiraceae bacterium]|nr:MBL fold metallo-hydrolase [Lachnospiraceae bacterium]